MPIYEYECSRCGIFEVNQRITESPLVKCPRCRGKVHKLISQSSFQLKGSGWYVTDYGRGNGKGNGNGRGKEHKESAEHTTSESTPSETKSKKAAAAKTAAK